MKLILQKALIYAPDSPYNGKEVDVKIEDGRITDIQETILNFDDSFSIINARGKILSNGWFDLRVNFRDPGSEQKEDLLSGCRAAMKGGFTEVLLMPDTHPVIQTKSEVEYVNGKTKNQLVTVFVAGAISKDLEGKDLNELYDMYMAGARAFTDDKHALQNPALLTRALQYASQFGATIISFPNDRQLSGKGIVNESESTVHLGMKGIPAIAEEIMVSRDIFLSEYSDTPLHFTCISTAGSVELIRKAKAKGLKITADVTALHLYFTDDQLETFDSNLKLIPPLRTGKDVEALIKGLQDGTIDAICSDHSPEDTENKQLEFALAAPGASNIETAFSSAYTVLKDHMPVRDILRKFTQGPRQVLGLSDPEFKVGSPANLTLFDPSADWNVQKRDLLSKGINNPFSGTTLKGIVLLTINNNQIFNPEG